jgi:ketol-acid reductoisomerase
VATVYGDDDADLSLVQSRTVAVLGYGRDGEAHALSLRDSGVDVRVGLPLASHNRQAAEAEGLRVVEPAEACEESDLFVVLAPVAALRVLYEQAIAPNLIGGDALVFPRAVGVGFGLVQPPEDVDVIMVSPQGRGDLVRREFSAGRGVPTLAAVAQDATGNAWPLALSYARAIGGTRAGVLRTTVSEESIADLFGDQAVRSGGVPALVRAAIDTLVDAGVSPEIAYFACAHDLEVVASRLRAAATPDDPAAAWRLAEPRKGELGPGRRIVDVHVRASLAALLRDIQAAAVPSPNSKVE